MSLPIDSLRSTATDAIAGTLANTDEYLAFRLDRAEYGVRLSQLHDVRGYGSTSCDALSFLDGLGLECQGRLVPVVDLRVSFDISTPVHDMFSVVLVLWTHGRLVGIVADALVDIVRLKPDRITPHAGGYGYCRPEHVEGIGRDGARRITLLDVDTLVLAPELALID